MDRSIPRSLPLITIALFAPAVGAPPIQSAPLFTEQERQAVVEYWAEPARYEARPLGETKGQGRWYARYTSEGSTWIRELYRLRSEAKVVPTVAPEALTEQQARWDAWVEARVQFDKWTAEQEAALRNAQEANVSAPEPSAPRPEHPGDLPEDLAAALPVPPPFYAPAVPYAHKVAFDDGIFEYLDHVGVPHKYAYFRFEKGIRSSGARMAELPSGALDGMLVQAGVTDAERRVFMAVSLLEGGFDAVNTYDTGFVSVGFIQFASLSHGAGSLGAVLLRMKTGHAEAFQANFRRFGVDVTPEGVLVALDPTTALEFVGPDANQRIIHDKRLIAVFQRAGRRSEEFKVCQLAVAKQLYYPAEDELKVEFGGKTLVCRVKDVFKSEAGLATLMDRKVNTGKLDQLNEFLFDIVSQTGMTDLREASKYEWALVRAMQYRANYLGVSALSQPAQLDITLSRGNSPRDRRGGG